MIVVITMHERNPRTGRWETICSHGIDESTGRTVTLPSVTPQSIGAQFDAELNEYVLSQPERRNG